jgi:hypothetical protein
MLLAQDHCLVQDWAMSIPSQSPLLADALPQLAHELEELLKERHEPELAARGAG